MGKIVGGIGKLLLGGVGGLAARALLKKPKTPQTQGMATYDDAAATLAAEDELRKRRGGMADIITGTRGAEALPTAGRIVRGN